MGNIEQINGGKNTLMFHGVTVEFDPGLFYFAEINHRFAPVIAQCIANIDKRFGNELGDMQSVISNIDGVLGNVFNPLIDFSIKQLSLLGCYDFDPESFFDKYVKPKFGEILDIKNSLISAENSIDSAQESRNEMRTARRQNIANQYLNSNDRDNANLVQGAKNAFGWLADQCKNQAERDRIYGQVKNKIKIELKWICHDMPGSVAQAVYKSTGLDIRDPRTAEDYNRAENIFKNIKSGNVPGDSLDRAALDVFSLNPQEPGFLQWCVKQYGDPDGEFENAASIFHVDIKKTKYEILGSAIHLETEESALASKEALEELQKNLSVSSPELMQKVEDALIAFDKEARTVSGVEFDTREEAKEARRQLQLLNDMIAAGDTQTEDGTKKLLNEIDEAGLTVCFVEEAKRQLNEKLVKFDLDARTVCGKEYRTREEAEDARRQLQTMETILGAGDLKTEDGINAVLAEFEKAGLNAFFAEAKKQELQKELIRIDTELRTVDDIEYKTREEAALARHELDEVTKLYSSCNFDNPELCRSFLSNVAALELKTGAADKITKEIENRCTAQEAKLGQIVKKYGFSQEEAQSLLTRHSMLARSGLSKLKMFDLADTNLGDVAVNFSVPQDDIIIGMLDLCNSRTQGILITRAGLFSRNVPFLRSKNFVTFAGFIGSPLLAILLYCMVINNPLPGAMALFLIFIVVLLLFVVPIGMFLFRKKIISKIDAANISHFTEWAGAFPELSADKAFLFLSKDNHFKLPYGSPIINEFPKLKRMIEEQQALSAAKNGTAG